jgi:hypothetical protein
VAEKEDLTITWKDGMSDFTRPEGWRVAGREQGGRNYSDTGEKWKQWKDSPYEVSSGGKVRRKGEKVARKPRDDDRKHQRMNMTWNGKREEPLVHQMVMDLFGPPKPQGEHIVILHKDNNGTNNSISNLKWGTRSENVQQAHNDGLIKPKKKK